MRLRKLVTMRDALESDGYFGRLLAGDSWAAWRVLLIAIVGEELTEDESVIFRALTGRISEPLEPIQEFWAIVGRRGGKTRSMSILAAYIAACCDHRDVLAPGERGVLPILAASTAQASQAFNFVSGIFATAPNLKDLVRSETSDTISLKSGVDITIRAASFRTIRGMTAVGAIAEEIAFWRSDDSANPDREILKALRPSCDHQRSVDLHLEPAREARRTVRDIQAPFRSDRPSVNPGRQGAEPDDEPEPKPACRRSRHGGRPRGGERGVWRRIPRRPRDLRQPRSDRGLRCERRHGAIAAGEHRISSLC